MGAAVGCQIVGLPRVGTDMSDQIHCPKCGYEFEASAGMREHLELELRQQLRAEHERRLSEQARLAEERLLEKELELGESRRKAADAAVKEAEVLRKERELQDRERQSTLDLERKLAEETQRIRTVEAAAAEERAARTTREQLRVKDEELVEARAKAAEAHAMESELLKKQREVEEREGRLTLDLDRKLAEETHRIRAVEAKAAEERVARLVQEQLHEKDAELLEARAKVVEARAKESELLKKQRELEDREGQVALDVERQLAAERERIQADAARAADERAALRTAEELRTKDEELAAAREKAKQATAREAELIRTQRLLEEQQGELALQVERKVAEESRRVHAQAQAQAEELLRIDREKRQLQDEEQRQKQAALQRQVDDLQQRVRQGSQQAQGEAQEVVLGDILTDGFPEDLVEDVPKGVCGADLIEHVRSVGGCEHGTIVWESKRTKTWSDEWLSKLRDDQRAVGAACAVIVSQALPEGVQHFEFREGVWICAWPYAGALAAALRQGLIEVSRTRQVSQGRGEKMRMMYEYLTGPEFRNCVSGLVEAFCEMEEELRGEKRAMAAIWKKREKQIVRARLNIGAFYGELQGIAGRQIADLPELSLDAIAMLGTGDASSDDDAPSSEPSAGGVGVAPDERLVDVLYALLATNGAPAGNSTLRARFYDTALEQHGVEISEDDYERCKEVLLARGLVRKGKGRGGSVARVMHAAAE